MGLLDGFSKFLGVGADALSGGLFSLGSSLINGITTSNAQKQANATNVELARMNNEAALNMMRENNEFNKQAAIDMFNMQNEYNDPSSQVERLRKAGINPSAVLGGQGTTIANTGNVSPATSSGNVSLTTPRVEPVTPVSAQMLESLATLSQIQVNRSKIGLQDSETWKNYQKTEKEISALEAEIKNKQAITNYQELQTYLDSLFTPFERDAKIKEVKENTKNLAAMSFLNGIKGDTEKAQQDLLKIEKVLKDTENKQLIAKFPYVIAQLEGTINLLKEQTATEKTKQELNRTSSSVNRGLSALYQISADLEAAKRDWMTNRSNNEYGFPTESNLEKIFNTEFRQALSNLSKTDKEAAKIDKEIDNLMIMAKQHQKELDWFLVDKVWNMFIDFSEQNRKAASTILPFVTPFKLGR